MAADSFVSAAFTAGDGNGSSESTNLLHSISNGETLVYVLLRMILGHSPLDGWVSHEIEKRPCAESPASVLPLPRLLG